MPWDFWVQQLNQPPPPPDAVIWVCGCFLVGIVIAITLIALMFSGSLLVMFSAAALMIKHLFKREKPPDSTPKP